MGVCNCSMFCCTLLYVHSSIAIILMGKRELVALLNLSSWCLVVVGWLFLAVPWGCLRFVIVVFPDHTHLLFLHLHSLISLNNMSLLCFTVLCVVSSFKSSHRGRENWLLYFCCVLNVMSLLLFFDSSGRCHGLTCSI